MEWNIDFLNRETFKKHVTETIKVYIDVINPMTLAKFNSNIIDPIKLTFDSKVYKKTIEETIIEEMARQRDKSNTNAIGYFHQKLFSYIKNCIVPQHGFDVIFTRNDGTIINVELKNKHNTMNSSSSQKTYMKMQNHLLNNPNDFCYLVEVIASKSQNIEWKISLDGNKISDKRIRRVSIDKFYEEITGENDAFKKLCDQLPDMIQEIVDERTSLSIGQDIVLYELNTINTDLLKALYILAFKTYEGF